MKDEDNAASWADRWLLSFLLWGGFPPQTGRGSWGRSFPGCDAPPGSRRECLREMSRRLALLTAAGLPPAGEAPTPEEARANVIDRSYLTERDGMVADYATPEVPSVVRGWVVYGFGAVGSAEAVGEEGRIWAVPLREAYAAAVAYAGKAGDR